ncbi:MAG: DUF1993 domain-containing protein [Rubrivivax sp.]|jgi:hypothetical protein
MSLSMHSASVPVFVKMLGNLLTWLDKAQAHAEARRFDPVQYLSLKLAPDMLPLTRQIQIATDAAKGCAARLAGHEVPKWADDESTLEQLRERVRRTIDYVQSVPAAAFEGSETREVVLQLRAGELRYQGEDYLRHFALPNFYFHVTTTYALLRQAGVEIGKRDFLGQ